MKSTKIFALILVIVMCVTALASCFGGNNDDNQGNNNGGNNGQTPGPGPGPGPGGGEEDDGEIKIVEGDFTYKGYASALGTNWNPHTWENSSDDSILSYISAPFVTMAPLDTEEGIYQWIYDMATEITDVTAEHKDDITKYGSTIPEGTALEDIEEGYVFEIKLNPNAKWQNGDVINADSYLYSMEKLLNSKMRNYRANLYYAGESAVAGGAGYFNSEAPIYSDVVSYPGDEPVWNVDPSTVQTYISLTEVATISSYTFKVLYEDYGVISDETYKALAELTNSFGYIPVNDETMDLVKKGMVEYCSAFNFGPDVTPEMAAEAYFDEFLFYVSGVGDKVEFDTVGLYKVDDYTIRYVCQTAIDFNYFLTSCTSTWLVHPETYEATMEEKDGLTITKYCTSKDTSMSYGPYMIQTFEDDKQVVFVQNPNYHGYQTTDSGYLYSITEFEVDGKQHQQYQTTKVIIDVMTQSVAYEAFLKGDIDEYAPTPEELTEYTLSDRLLRVDETYTMSFFFNTNEQVLKNLDDNGGNENSIVLTNYNFRKAFSLAFNRADFVTVTEGYTPAYSLMNKLYHYDIYNDPTSSYRSSDPAMQAICNLYGVKYGENEIYKTLEEAYNSITGYNLTEAKALMKQAHDELVAAGLYVSGEPITIQIGWKAGAMEAADNSQVDKVQGYLNAAVEGSGFGKVTIEGLGNLDDRYGDVPAGRLAVGYGAWGGAAFYPFRNFQVYCDTEQYAGQINETGCWNPAETELTIQIDELGEEPITMTWQDWSRSMIGDGPFALVDNDIKLKITAIMEEEFLKFYYRIPLCGTTICSLLGYKMDNYTDDYNIMYGFGGFRLMKYNFTDAEWTDYVASVGGTLNYK